MRKTVLWCLLAALLVVGLAADSYAVLYTCQVNAVGVEEWQLSMSINRRCQCHLYEQRFILGTVC